MPVHTSEVPRPVRIAALLFVIYGVMVLVNALVLQSSAEWAQARDFPRAVLRLAGCGLVAYGLMRTLRWAWWVAVVLGSLWAVMSALAFLLLMQTGRWADAAPSAPVFLVAVAVVMGAAVALLLQPASRDAFR